MNEDVTANRARARALPIFGAGRIPADRERSLEDDNSGFIDVLRLFLRSWPYIRPLLLGRWWLPGQGREDRVAETVGDGG